MQRFATGLFFPSEFTDNRRSRFLVARLPNYHSGSALAFPLVISTLVATIS
ncbi:hypothetical protein SAMN05446635_5356 [Burkholderia sp. OK233]|nr:hypothetical protein SAMN05446635_5356 [Burkholderia sp. OK233]